MSWFFFFIFTIASLNLVVVYSLLKRVGLDAGELLVGSLLALLSAVVCYNVATDQLVGKEINVLEISKQY